MNTVYVSIVDCMKNSTLSHDNLLFVLVSHVKLLDFAFPPTPPSLYFPLISCVTFPLISQEVSGSTGLGVLGWEVLIYQVRRL